MVNYQEFIIPESNRGYYKYYKFELTSNNSHTRLTQLALFSKPLSRAWGTWDYTYCTTLRDAFYRCGCLGINQQSSFKMDGCNFANLTAQNSMYETFRESFGHSSYTNGNIYEEDHKFDITNVNTVTENSTDISNEIQLTNGWNTFELLTLDPSGSDFYSKEYEIEWEDDPVSYQHGGYYLTYNGLNNFSDDFIHNGGPIWWWYWTQGYI